MLFIIRGIPGSGKSTYAMKLKDAIKDDSVVHYEADMYFSKDGEYKFDPTKLKDAHGWCIEKAKEDLRQGKTVIVSNTFTRKWEMEPYLEAVKEMDLPLAVIRMENRFKNIHGVPEEAVKAMEDRFEDCEGEVVVSAVEVALGYLESVTKKISAGQEARRLLKEEAVKEDGLLILPRFLPWQDAVMENEVHKDVIFVIFPSKTPGQWIAQAAPIEKGSFKTRKSFPKEWGGLTDEKLTEVSGVPDAVFCHKGLFLVVAGSKEGAVAMAKKALAEG